MKIVALILSLARQEVGSDDGLSALESSYEKAADVASRAVVAIRVDRETVPLRFNPFGGGPIPEIFAKRPRAAWCTGLIVEPGGTILTTHFNVSGTVKSIRVVLQDGREFQARLLGYDGTYDLAALKIEATGLPTLQKSQLKELKAGQPVVALGRAPDGRGLTVNPGIVSAASRLGGKGIQTDAKLNFGNVGGPLVDLEGRLIAITCKVDTKLGISTTRGQNSGVGFAITHDRFSEALVDLKVGKNVAESRRAFLGIRFDEKGAKEGVALASVEAGGAAERAGIKAGDVIVELDGAKLSSFDELRAVILRKSPGDHIKVKVERGEVTLEFDCELGWAPGE
jgi:S1-C subfamily serine protease